MSMDLTGMCNINMMYFLIAVFLCIFVADDFRSGYAKNLFAVRSKKVDYCISKTAVGFVGGVIMIAAYFVGAMLGGAIAGLSFDTGTQVSVESLRVWRQRYAWLRYSFPSLLLFSVVGKTKAVAFDFRFSCCRYAALYHDTDDDCRSILRS